MPSRFFHFLNIYKNKNFMAEKNFGKIFDQIFFSKKFFDRRKNFIFHFIKKMKKTAGHNLVVNLCFKKLSNRMKIERMRPERARTQFYAKFHIE